MTKTRRHRLLHSCQRLVAARAAEASTAASKQLRHDLACYSSRADLLDLVAMMERYEDAETEPLRTLLHWPTAA
jgi:hypothetical protein